MLNMCVLFLTDLFCFWVTRIWVISAASAAGDQQLSSCSPATCAESSQEWVTVSWRLWKQRLHSTAYHRTSLWTRIIRRFISQVSSGY